MQIKGSPVLWFLKRIYFYFIYVYVLVRATWCRCLYRPEEVRVWNSLQLELQSVVSCSKWMLGTKSRFSGTALKHWAISPPHGLLFLGTRPEDFASIGCENIEVVVGLFKIYSVMILKERLWHLASVIFSTTALPQYGCHAIWKSFVP